MNNSPSGANAPKKSNFSAAILTIVICIILAAGAVIISLFSPGSEFEFIPFAKKPGEVHFSDMNYERPNGAAISDNLSKLTDMIKSNKSFTEQSRLFTTINTDLSNYKTMMSLAEIHYYKDTTDDFYKTESDFLKDEYVGIYNKICILLDTIETSSFKVNYERSFLGSGYFNNWTPMTKSPEAIKLLKEEQALISEYQDLLSNAFVNYKGEYVSVHSEEMAALSPDQQAEVIDLYYEKYNPLLGNIYAELTILRLELAKEMNTDYVSYAYKSFDRDYTPEQANAYMDEIAKHVFPLASKINYDSSELYEKADTMTSFYSLAHAAGKMGGDVEKAFNYMMKYGLFELSASENKVGLSFETFLDKYNTPFIFTSSTGTANDFLTYAHEFGHFVYDYVNLGAGVTIDSTEIASQAMAYIMPLYSNGIGSLDGNDMLRCSLNETIDLYFSACFINKFETAVYALPKDEITAEKMNELAKEIALEIGLSKSTADSLSMSWIELQHIYIYPMYYVSYVVSNDTSLQILEAELNGRGEGGVKTLDKLLTKDHALPLYDSLKKEGFESPFDAGRAEKIADLICRVFGIENEKPAEEAPAA